MIKGLFSGLIKMIACVFFLAIAGSQTSLASELVDLERNHNVPLGKILGNKAGDQIYFSLGNGRAIKISLLKSTKREQAMLKNLVLDRAENVIRSHLVKRQNLKW